MMSARKAYKPRATSVPMLVNRLVHQNVENIEEFGVLMAFQYGVANQQHYDYLVRMANMLNIAQQCKPSAIGLSLVTNINWLAAQISARYNSHGKFGVAGQELGLMRRLVLAYDAYWKSQTTNLYNQCVAELLAFYADLEANKAAA